MKKSLFLAVLCSFAASFAQGACLTEPVLISFGTANASNITNEKADATYKGEQKTWNKVSSNGNNGGDVTDLVDGGGNACGASIHMSAPVCGNGGLINSFAGDESTLAALGTYMPADFIQGCCAHSGVQITFSGLAAGTYTLQVLAARGNSYSGIQQRSTYSITGDVLDVHASVLASSNTGTGNGPVLLENDTKVDALTYNTGGAANTADNWALIDFTFTVGDSGTFSLYVGRSRQYRRDGPAPGTVDRFARFAGGVRFADARRRR